MSIYVHIVKDPIKDYLSCNYDIYNGIYSFISSLIFLRRQQKPER